MDDNLIILKNRQLPPSKDYEFLRKQGLEYIEKLSHEIWTDYNTHDPGITILEALCYALTELGYRCGFDIKDLLTKNDGNLADNQVFFTAKKILTNNPLTINDYRKLLVDIEGIENAWLFAEDFILDEKKNKLPVNEIPVYADCKKDRLTYTETAVPLYLSGLYRVLLDLEDDDKYGDLNNGDVITANPQSTGFKKGEFFFSIGLLPWKDADFNFAANASDENNFQSVFITGKEKHWKCRLELIDSSSIEFIINILKRPASKDAAEPDIHEMFNTKEFISSIFQTYYGKILKAKEIVQTAVRKLNEKRNLCEDFVSVTTVDDEEISFCFDVDVKPSADLEKIEAEVFYIIENYLNPPIDFFTLRELLDKKIPVDKIFEGTVLQHGFIDTQQLEKTELRTVVHTSDIINLLMDIEGVTAVRNFMMTKYNNEGNPVNGFTGLKWCMDISYLHKPVLNTERSKILFFKDKFPFLASYDEVRDTVLLLHAERERAKLNGVQDDLPVPKGNKRDTESYWPVQYDFPQVYGIGEAGLPLNASAERTAKQRQLKGYLMFYEQLLSDFFIQLSNAHELFSTNDLVQTYYARFLEEIKDIDAVYNTADPPGYLKDILSVQNSEAEPVNGWQRLYEEKDTFENRRSRFLDHLLARFAESFNDYALMMYRINYEERTEEKIDFNELAESKINTLKEYDVISSERGKAYNYFPQTDDFKIDESRLWDTDNVSGLEKRISFLTGVKDYTRRFLYCIKNIEIICNEESVEENGNETIKCFHTFSFTSLSGIKMISKKFDKKDDAEKAALDVTEFGAVKDHYIFDESDSKLKITGNADEILMESISDFPDKDSAMFAAEKLSEEFSKECSDPAGLHLIEHILLRPRNSGFSLMEVCLNGCDCPCEIDPYTFKASVVLPYWPSHFDSMVFRSYFEDKMREEAPAHIMLKICWLNNDLLREFETRYKTWIEALADYSYDKEENINTFKEANDNMIDILKQLHSEYPKATLHDCSESKEGINPVMLGKTVLGTFKN